MAEQKQSGWQSVLLTILSGVLTASIIGLTVTLSGLREDLAVVKRDVQYLTMQASQAEAFRSKMSDEINSMKMKIQRLEQDHTGSK